jgi:hypothetical protein
VVGDDADVKQFLGIVLLQDGLHRADDDSILLVSREEDKKGRTYPFISPSHLSSCSGRVGLAEYWQAAHHCKEKDIQR